MIIKQKSSLPSVFAPRQSRFRLLGGDVLAFARTHFARAERVVT